MKPGIFITLVLQLITTSWVFAQSRGSSSNTRTGDRSDQHVEHIATDATASTSLELAREMVVVVARLRQLGIRRRVEMGVLDRHEIMAEVSRRLSLDYTENDVLAEAALLKRLGLLPAHLDYKQAVLELLTDQIAGFYDPEQKRLNVASWLPLALQKPTLVHEICHALQDQYFPLRQLMKPDKEESDQQLARAALVEGDCTAVMLEYALAQSGLDLSYISPGMNQLVDQLLSGAFLGSASEAFRRAPVFLRETLTFPYFQGMRFVQKVRAAHGWAGVSRLLRHPPSTTEQILHFEKFQRGEHGGQPLHLVRPGGLSGYRLLKQDTLGEFQIGLYLRQAVEPAVATRASAGWSGDRLAIYQPSADPTANTVLVHLSRWDSADEAGEFRDAQRRVMSKLAGQALRDHGRLATTRDRLGLLWTIEQRGIYVLSTMAAPHGVHEQCWESTR